MEQNSGISTSTIPSLRRWMTHPAPTSMQWELVTHTKSYTSPLTGYTQLLANPNSHWRAHVSYALHGEETVRQMTTFILSLNGPQGKFLFFPPHAKTPKGHASGAPVIKGANQKGSQLITSGWQQKNGDSTVLKKGDSITILLANGHNSLHSLTSDAVVTSTNDAHLAITPPLRLPPRHGSRVITHDCFCVMRLANDKQSRFSFEKMSQASMQFELIESYP